MSYSLYVTAASVAERILGAVLGDVIGSPLGIALQVAMLVGLVLLLRVDWTALAARYGSSTRDGAPSSTRSAPISARRKH